MCRPLTFQSVGGFIVDKLHRCYSEVIILYGKFFDSLIVSGHNDSTIEMMMMIQMKIVMIMIVNIIRIVERWRSKVRDSKRIDTITY